MVFENLQNVSASHLEALMRSRNVVNTFKYDPNWVKIYLLCHEPRYCSASYMFVTRGLPTCKMLIRKKLYSFMMCIAKSGNTILQRILNSDAFYTSQMYQHWRSVLYINHF